MFLVFKLLATPINNCDLGDFTWLSSEGYVAEVYDEGERKNIKH